MVKYKYDVHLEAGTGDAVDALPLLRDVQDQILHAVAVELLHGCEEPLRRLDDGNSSNVTLTVVNILEVSLKPLDIMLSPSGEDPIDVFKLFPFSIIQIKRKNTILFSS